MKSHMRDKGHFTEMGAIGQGRGMQLNRMDMMRGDKRGLGMAEIRNMMTDEVEGMRGPKRRKVE